MLICRKHPAHATTDAASDALTTEPLQGGPVFLPPRKLSALAQALVGSPLPAHAGPVDGDRVTAYDELWLSRRPSF